MELQLWNTTQEEVITRMDQEIWEISWNGMSGRKSKKNEKKNL